MTATNSLRSSPPRRPVSSPARKVALAFAIAVLVFLVLLEIAWLNRRAATRQVLVGWLERHGVPADVDIQSVELDRMVARIRLGDPQAPDAVVERVELDYAIGLPWSRAGLGVRPSRIRLLRPVVRARLENGAISLGSLDPVIKEFTGRPPQPDSRAPLVLVEHGRLLLSTAYGEAVVLADARIDDGKLMRLSARMPVQSLASRHADARDLSASLELATKGDQVALNGRVEAGRLLMGDMSADTASISIAGQAPYPDVRRRRHDGVARLTARVAAAEARAGEARLAGGGVELDFDGRVDGWLDAFSLTGRLGAEVRAETAATPGARLGRAVLSASRASVQLSGGSATPVSWRAEGPVDVSFGSLDAAGLKGRAVSMASQRLLVGGRGRAAELQGQVDLAIDRLNWEQLTLGGVGGRTSIDAVMDDGVRVTMAGRLNARRGAWPLLGAHAGGDVPELTEMKRALNDFALVVPRFDLLAGDAGARITLDQPMTLVPANGGRLAVSQLDRPIFSTGRGGLAGGAFSLTATRGRGLPEAQLEVADWRLIDSGFVAEVHGSGRLDFGMARGLRLQTQGRLTSAKGRMTYAANDCIPVTVERLELGENDVADLSGGLCPGPGPMVSVFQGGWAVQGRWRELSASVPFLALHLRGAEGLLLAEGRPAGIDMTLEQVVSEVVDATAPRRFNPLRASGSASLRADVWSGVFDLSREDAGLGRLTLRHDGRLNVGGLDIDAPGLVFSENGLQPSDLSPLASAFVGSPVAGSVGFQGRVDWSANAEGSSRGRLTIADLDFISPMGLVEGLTGTVDFTNLAPFETAPGQHLRAESVQALTKLEDVQLSFALDKAALRIDGGETFVGGGRVRLEPLTLPLEPGKGFTGVIVLENVQLNDILAGSGFGDKVKLDAVVSGRLPFVSDPGGLRITGGTLAAVRPGRLSIAREALSGLEAAGGGDVPPNTIQDLAYQAMENLSFDILSAEVNSLDAGRLGVVFRIRGRHDPPVRQELRVGLTELISREFLKRKLPLPSGTAIDLTLDTTLNANQLVADLLQINRARSGDADGSDLHGPP